VAVVAFIAAAAGGRFSLSIQTFSLLRHKAWIQLSSDKS
jgi:hypothetical protein